MTGTRATIATLASALIGGCYAGSSDDADTEAADSSTSATSMSSTTASTAGPSSAGTNSGSASTTAGPGPSTTDQPTTTTDDGTTTDAPPIDEPLIDRLDVADVQLPAGIRAGVNNWRIWGTGPLNVAPIFTVPRGDCGTMLGTTTDDGIAATVVLLDDSDAVADTIVLGQGLELRGLASEADGHFGALLWDDAADRIWVRRYDAAGTEVWSTELTNPDNRPDDFGIGDSRLEFGDGRYGAYYHVHSDSGHEGDTLKWVDAGSGAETTGWSWGCSHSMSNVLRYHPDIARFMPACVTDCFPGTSGDFVTNAIGGIYLNHSEAHVLDVDAGCNGSVAGEIGSAALMPNGWSLVFNAHQAPATLGQDSYDESSMNQDVGISMIDSDLTPGPVVWLTDTPGLNEDDTSIARWTPAGDDAEQYLVGWHEPGAAESWKLARIDPSGAFVEGPVDVTGSAHWGRRDDPFRRDLRGDVRWSWADAPGSTTLHTARVRSGGQCGG